MFKNLSKIGMLLILILLAFFVVEAFNVKEGMSSDMVSNNANDPDSDPDSDPNSDQDEGFDTINNFSIGSNY